MLKEIISIFEKQFSDKPRIFRAPGRINIIGEHTDYNEGFVLPAAINKELFFAIAPNNENKYRFFSYNFSDYTEITTIAKQKNKIWLNYLLGVLSELEKDNIHLGGIDLVFGGNIPAGAGLSSSAALECGFLYALNELFSLGLNKMKMAQICQNAEHEFVGVKCGIMDQFASLFGKKKHVIKLDCKTLDYEYIPFNIDNYKLILCNSNVKHSLASSEYNVRRKECELGIETLSKYFHQIKSLRDTSMDMLIQVKPQLSETIFQRCKYVIEENIRVKNVCDALKNNCPTIVGKNMYRTHEGLKNEYNVSCSEIDEMVDIAKSIDGVVGARIMGGGFGGCTLNLVQEDEVPVFIESMKKLYYKNGNGNNSIFSISIVNGVSEIINN